MRKLKKIASTLCAAALAASAFAAVGCSSSQGSSQSAESDFQPEEIQVNTPGYTITDDGMLQYAFIAVNPNEGHVATDVFFSIEAYDASGSMIAGGGETIPVLYPGVETAAAGESELFSLDTDSPEVASLTISPMSESATWETTDETASQVEDEFQIVSPRMSTADDGTMTIKATINRPEQAEGQPSSVVGRAVAVLFDEQGSAICGTSPVVFELNSDAESYQFEATISDAPAYSECSLYVTPDELL